MGRMPSSRVATAVGIAVLFFSGTFGAACAAGSSTDGPVDIPDTGNGDASVDVTVPDGDGAACPASQTSCGGKCVITQLDPANCGACGTVCPAGQACVA